MKKDEKAQHYSAPVCVSVDIRVENSILVGSESTNSSNESFGESDPFGGWDNE